MPVACLASSTHISLGTYCTQPSEPNQSSIPERYPGPIGFRTTPRSRQERRLPSFDSSLLDPLCRVSREPKTGSIATTPLWASCGGIQVVGSRQAGRQKWGFQVHTRNEDDDGCRNWDEPCTLSTQKFTESRLTDSHALRGIIVVECIRQAKEYFSIFGGFWLSIQHATDMRTNPRHDRWAIRPSAYLRGSDCLDRRARHRAASRTGRRLASKTLVSPRPNHQAPVSLQPETQVSRAPGCECENGEDGVWTDGAGKPRLLCCPHLRATERAIYP